MKLFNNPINVILLLSCYFINLIYSSDTIVGRDYSGKDNITKWPSQQEEALDEVDDAKIILAVQNSIKEWEELKHHSTRKKRATKRVCYDELGCFEDSGPFSYLEMLPSHPEEINTKFYFYSTKHRSERPLLELSFLNMTSSFEKSTERSKRNISSETTTPFSRFSFTMDDLNGFDELSVRVIVHGFGSACPHVWIYEMKTALMAVENCIVICVDWENGANLPNYVKAATNTRLVGKQLAMLLLNLKEHKNLNLAKTHIIGFSLGAHVAGFAGAELKGLNRITGLDPAGPLFESQHPKARLDSSDAEYVDVIHSNGENLILGGLGSYQPMGHVDFYPNGGRVQTGCSNLFLGAVTDFIWAQPSENEARSLCNHRRAYKFFIDSVAPRCLFPAFPCDSYENFIEGKCFPCKNFDNTLIDNENNSMCGNMGYYADKSTGRGQLYLVTREEEPFCAHQFKIEIFNSFNDLPLRTIGKLEATLEGEGGLNETFLISEKEDTEFFAGDIVSKIIVPHPALGFPTNLTLQYKSYSGWLSKGLPHWDIDKIVLTDSYGRSHSLCVPSLSLTSGSPHSFQLQQGICETVDITTTPITTEVAQTTTKPSDNPDEDGVEHIKHKKDVLNLGSNYDLENKKLNDTKKISDETWNLILEGNSLEKGTGESSRSLNPEASEIFEPVLKNVRIPLTRGRNMHSFDLESKEVLEPILKSTSPKNSLSKNSSLLAADDKSDDFDTIDLNLPSEPITVQLFPFRLGELLERAERYARETLLPLISEQAPKLFRFGFDNKKENTDRKPRYIPRYEEKKLIHTKIKKNGFDILEATQRILPSYPRNIFELSRPKIEKIKQQKSYTSVNYYSNKIADKWKFEDEKIRIELPTYKPTVKNIKKAETKVKV